MAKPRMVPQSNSFTGVGYCAGGRRLCKDLLPGFSSEIWGQTPNSVTTEFHVRETSGHRIRSLSPDLRIRADRRSPFLKPRDLSLMFHDVAQLIQAFQQASLRET